MLPTWTWAAAWPVPIWVPEQRPRTLQKSHPLRYPLPTFTNKMQHKRRNKYNIVEQTN